MEEKIFGIFIMTFKFLTGQQQINLFQEIHFMSLFLYPVKHISFLLCGAVHKCLITWGVGEVLYQDEGREDLIPSE